MDQANRTDISMSVTTRVREMGVAPLASPIPVRLTWSVRVLLKKDHGPG